MNAPPLLVSFENPLDYLSALSIDGDTPYRAEVLDLIRCEYPPVVSTSTLSTLFGFSPHFIQSLSKDNTSQYRSFKIKNGTKKREIHAPKVGIKIIQKWFGFHLSRALVFDDHVYGFIPNTSATDAVARHCGANWVYSVDIEDFFPSTTDKVVQSSLADIGYGVEAAKILSSLCCYKGALAQGSPSSPVLSNLSLKAVDTQLKELAGELSLNITRYADDVVFSGVDIFPKELPEQVRKIFENTCWNLNAKKEYFADAKKGQRLKVHGLLVKEDKPRLTKGYRNRIRAYRYLVQAGKVRAKDVAKIMGHIKFAESVENWSRDETSE